MKDPKGLLHYTCPNCDRWCWGLWKTRLGPLCSRCVREEEERLGENITTMPLKESPTTVKGR